MFSKIVRYALVDQNLSIAELARRMDTSRENLAAKIKRDNFSERDMQKIADTLNLKLEIRLANKSNEVR